MAARRIGAECKVRNGIGTRPEREMDRAAQVGCGLAASASPAKASPRGKARISSHRVCRRSLGRFPTNRRAGGAWTSKAPGSNAHRQAAAARGRIKRSGRRRTCSVALLRVGSGRTGPDPLGGRDLFGGGGADRFGTNAGAGGPRTTDAAGAKSCRRAFGAERTTERFGRHSAGSVASLRKSLRRCAAEPGRRKIREGGAGGTAPPGKQDTARFREAGGGKGAADGGAAIGAGARSRRRSRVPDICVTVIRPDRADTGRCRSTRLDSRSTRGWSTRRRGRTAAWLVAAAGSRHLRSSGVPGKREAGFCRKECGAFRVREAPPTVGFARHLPFIGRSSIVDSIVAGNRWSRRRAITRAGAGCSGVPASIPRAIWKDPALARTGRRAAHAPIVESRTLGAPRDILVRAGVDGASESGRIGPSLRRSLMRTLRMSRKSTQRVRNPCIRAGKRDHRSGASPRPAVRVRWAAPRRGRPGGTGSSKRGRSVRASGGREAGRPVAGGTRVRKIRFSAGMNELVRRPPPRRAVGSAVLRISRRSADRPVLPPAGAGLSGLASRRWTGTMAGLPGRPARPVRASPGRRPEVRATAGESNQSSRTFKVQCA